MHLIENMFEKNGCTNCAGMLYYLKPNQSSFEKIFFCFLVRSCFVMVFLALFACILLAPYATGGSNLNMTALKKKLLNGCSAESTKRTDPSINDPYVIDVAEARRQVCLVLHSNHFER